MPEEHQRKKKGSKPKPVVCIETDQVYPSAKVATEALGIKARSGIRTAIAERRTAGGFHWRYEEDPEPKEGQLRAARKRPVVCWETGEEYESLTAASQAVGVDATVISHAVAHGRTAGGYHWFRKGDPKPAQDELNGWKRVVCIETSQVFRNTRKAADWAGTTRAEVYEAIGSERELCGYHWRWENQPEPGELPKRGGGRKSRPVACVETGTVYGSAKEAAYYVGLKDPYGIHMAIRGKYKTAAGLHWVYAEEE